MSTTFKNTTSLQAAIKNLEEEQLIQKKQLIDSYNKKLQSYKPVNILKSTVSNISKKPLKKTAMIAGAGVGAAFLFRKFIFRKALSVPFGLLGIIGQAALRYTLSSKKNK